MWHIFPHGDHMEIESLRLNLQPLYREQPSTHIREEPENRETQATRSLGRVQPKID